MARHTDMISLIADSFGDIRVGVGLYGVDFGNQPSVALAVWRRLDH
jgi:hypothetical protein